LGVLTAGCKADTASGSTPANFSVTVDGTIDGGTLDFIDVGSLSGQGGTNGSPLSYAEVYATSKVPACGWLDGTNVTRANLTTLALLVTNTGGSQAPPPIGPGTYALGNTYNQDAGVNQQVTANILFSNATCQSGPLTMQANMGNITFTSIAADSIVGTYDVTFYTGDHLTGSFTAPTCTSALPELPEAGDAGIDAAPDASDASNCHP
jgi:hypothetical protein